MKRVRTLYTRKVLRFFDYKWEPDSDRVDDVDRSGKIKGVYIEHAYQRYEKNGKNYYVYEGRDNYDLFVEAPLIMEDKLFKWKKNSKYRSLEAIIKEDTFEFQCIINPDGNGKVIVRYLKCENKHRNNVTLAELDVSNAYNEVFIETIKDWKYNLVCSIRTRKVG